MVAAENITNIDELVTRLRKPCSDELFDDIANKAWKILQLQGDPALVLVLFEAFLIEAICLNTPIDNNEEGSLSRDAAQKRDLALLAFGLLDGYYHTEYHSDGKRHVPLDNRRMNYLHKSDYLDLNYPGKYSKSDISKKRSFDPWQTITSFDSRYQKDLKRYLTMLVKRGACTQVMQAGTEKHTQMVTMPDGSTARQIILPKPCFTKENFPSAEPVKPSSTSGTASNPPDPTPAPTPDLLAKDTHPALLLWSRGLLAVCIALIVCLALTIVCLIYSNRAKPLSETAALDRLEVQSIAFVELSELRVLAPGESIVLSVEIDPDEIGPEELDYISDQPEVAYTDKNAVTALPNLPSSIDEVVTITAQKGVVEDKTYVHVLGTDSAGIGRGTNATGDGMEGGE